MGLAPPSSVSDRIYTLSCVSLQATKKPAHRQAGPLRTRRYTPCTDSLSRPIVGHTPRKLPPFGAISRIIATAPLKTPRYHTTHSRVCQGGFEKNFGGFSGICRGGFVNFAAEGERPRSGNALLSPFFMPLQQAVLQTEHPAAVLHLPAATGKRLPLALVPDGQLRPGGGRVQPAVFFALRGRSPRLLSCYRPIRHWLGGRVPLRARTSAPRASARVRR